VSYRTQSAFIIHWIAICSVLIVGVQVRLNSFVPWFYVFLLYQSIIYRLRGKTAEIIIGERNSKG
jgi:hypothetical protein